MVTFRGEQHAVTARWWYSFKVWWISEVPGKRNPWGLLMPLYSIEKQVLQAGTNFWNGSEYLFTNMPALKTNSSPFWHAVKMVSESLWLAKLSFSWNSALHFTQRDANKSKFTMHHEFALCSGEKEATSSCPRGIASHPSLLLDLIQSPLSASDIGLINFCLDFVLICHDLTLQCDHLQQKLVELLTHLKGPAEHPETLQITTS